METKKFIKLFGRTGHFCEKFSQKLFDNVLFCIYILWCLEFQEKEMCSCLSAVLQLLLVTVLAAVVMGDGYGGGGHGHGGGYGGSQGSGTACIVKEIRMELIQFYLIKYTIVNLLKIFKWESLTPFF